MDDTRIKDLQDFYLRASLQAYAGDGKYNETDDILGSKSFEVIERGLRYLDCYFSFGKGSGGQTLLYVMEEDIWRPIWLMQYYGIERTNHPGVKPLLKEALRVAYEANEFIGGRGPEYYPRGLGEKPELLYHNKVRKDATVLEGESMFWRFAGVEYITTGSPHYNELFFHSYHGGLIEPR